MLIVGLTGGMGAGKSTVAAELAEHGAVVIDADRIARRVVEPDQPAYRSIVERFGPDVMKPDGQLDRAAMAALVFSDPGALSALNAITHPAIATEMARQVAEHAGTDRVVILDIPLLTEALVSAFGMAGVVVVDAPEDVAIRRVVHRRGISEGDARARLAAQPSREQRRQLAGFVVDNGGSRSDLQAQMERVWAWIEDLRRTQG